MMMKQNQGTMPSFRTHFTAILLFILSYYVGFGKADFCKNDNGFIEMTCPGFFDDFDQSYCCGSSGSYYCCDWDSYDLYNDVAEGIATAIIIVIVIVVLIVVGVVGGIIACCVCGCLCCAKSTPKTRTTVVTAQPQHNQVMIQQPGYAPQQAVYPPQQQMHPQPGGAIPPPGAAYPPPGAAYPPPGAAYPPPGTVHPPGSAYPPPPSYTAPDAAYPPPVE